MVMHLRFLQPIHDLRFHLLVPPQAVRFQHGLVKRPNQHEYLIPSLLEYFDRSAEGLPLQRRLQVDPGKILLGDSAFVPRDRRMPQ